MTTAPVWISSRWTSRQRSDGHPLRRGGVRTRRHRLPRPREPGDLRILLYETDEGGIGVLDRMTDPAVWQAVARRALDILHINPDGTDADDACLESCYECLRSFYN